MTMKAIKSKNLIPGQVYYDAKKGGNDLRFIKKENGYIYFSPIAKHPYTINKSGMVRFFDVQTINWYYENSVISRGELINFFTSHPQLSANGFGDECDKRKIKVSGKLIRMILLRKRNLTKETAELILPVLIDYGYKSKEL
jgi:hypothetical protein